jgi:hypothetical protein
MAVVDTIRTTLGPRGMDKLIYAGRNITISNDGATIMKLLDVVHPAARTLVDIARSQDEEVRCPSPYSQAFDLGATNFSLHGPRVAQNFLISTRME